MQDFLKQIKLLGKIPEGAMLVTAGVVRFQPNIPQDLGLQSLRKRFNEMGICKVPTEEINKFNEKVCKQISGTAIGTKFAPSYACIFMNEMETSFLKRQQLQALT